MNLYLLECHGMYKVGITNNVAKRIRTLQTGSPYPIKLVHSVIGVRKLITGMEMVIHSILEPYRSEGGGSEWFSFNGTNHNILASIDVIFRAVELEFSNISIIADKINYTREFLTTGNKIYKWDNMKSE